jgi:hypothetical protein
MSTKPGFYWDPSFTAALTAEDRRKIAWHEKMHLMYSARRMTPQQYTDALNRIEAFERGETTDLSGETPTVLFVSGLSNEEADRRISQITQDFVVNGGFDMRDFPGRK